MTLQERAGSARERRIQQHIGIAAARGADKVYRRAEPARTGEGLGLKAKRAIALARHSPAPFQTARVGLQEGG